MALYDTGEPSHPEMAELYRKAPRTWIVPSAVIPEADYLFAKRMGHAAQDLLFEDLAAARLTVEWSSGGDLISAHRLSRRYAGLGLGYVDSMVMATAVRLNAEAIATLDLRHFAAVSLPTHPRLLPRDR